MGFLSLHNISVVRKTTPSAHIFFVHATHPPILSMLNNFCSYYRLDCIDKDRGLANVVSGLSPVMWHSYKVSWISVTYFKVDLCIKPTKTFNRNARYFNTFVSKVITEILTFPDGICFYGSCTKHRFFPKYGNSLSSEYTSWIYHWCDMEETVCLGLYREADDFWCRLAM